jgi:hypothetical protein
VLAISACLSEAVLRLYHHLHPTFLFPSNHYSRFRGLPFAPDFDTGFHLNSHGFKDVEYETAKKPGTVRILAIGDSFVFGAVPYPFNFLTLLEQDLGQRDPPAEVINMGIPGIGPREYVEVLANEGLPLSADVVLVTLFLGNDFNVEPASPPRSYLLAFLRFLGAMFDRGQSIHGVAHYAEDRPNMDPAQYLEVERIGSFIFRKSNPAFSIQLSAVLAALQQIQQMCKDRGMELLVVLAPAQAQVNPSLQWEIVRAYPGREADFDFLFPNRRLNAGLDRLGIRHVDLTGPFREAARARPLYLPRDTHWNIAGNRLAADLIRDELLQKGTKARPASGR